MVKPLIIPDLFTFFFGFVASSSFGSLISCIRFSETLLDNLMQLTSFQGFDVDVKKSTYLLVTKDRALLLLFRDAGVLSVEAGRKAIQYSLSSFDDLQILMQTKTEW